jgi:hypothetical protein
MHFSARHCKVEYVEIHSETLGFRAFRASGWLTGKRFPKLQVRGQLMQRPQGATPRKNFREVVEAIQLCDCWSKSGANCLI